VAEEMPIIHRVEPAGNHHCDPPYNPKPETIYGAGTIWQCDVCGRKAKLVSDQRDGWIWQWMYP
jgi:hypothetical protein